MRKRVLLGVPALVIIGVGGLFPPSEAPTAHADANGWRTYRNRQAGYAIDYPVGWKVHRRRDGAGSSITTFASPDGTAGVAVQVQTQVGTVGPTDLPNSRCHPVRAHGITGTRCLDTISLSVQTVFLAHGKVYTVAASAKRSGTAVYDHMVQSFRLLR
jgi:hypothetical protein